MTKQVGDILIPWDLSGLGEATWCDENLWEPGGVAFSKALRTGGQAGVSVGRQEGRQESGWEVSDAWKWSLPVKLQLPDLSDACEPGPLMPSGNIKSKPQENKDRKCKGAQRPRLWKGFWVKFDQTSKVCMRP